MNEELKVIISAEISDLKKGCQDAKKSIEGVAEETKSMKQKIKQHLKEAGDGYKKIGEVSKAALKAVGTAVIGATATLIGLSAATAEYRENQAKLTTAFESAGASAETASQTYNDLYRVLGDDGQAVEAANHLAKLTTNQQELSEWTTICEGVYATFGDSIPIEGLTEAANETAKVGQVTGTLADALNWAGISEDEFNEKLAACNTEAEREKLIRETLNGVYSGAASNYEKNAAAMLAQNEAQAKMNASMAALGEAMVPINTALMNFAGQVLAAITPYIQSFATNYLPQIQDFLGKVAAALEIAIGFLADNWGIISQVAAILLAIAAAFSVLSTAIGIYNGVMAIAEVVSLPVIGVIALIVAGIVLLIMNWEKLSAVVKSVCETISKVVKSMVDAVVGFFTDLWNKVVSIATGIKDSVVNAFNAVKTTVSNIVNTVKTTVLNVFNGIKSGISTVINGIKTTVSNVFNSIKTTMVNGVTAAKNTVLGIFDGIKSGISNAINGAKNIVGSAIDAIKGFFKFEWSLPKLKLPHISIKGSFSLVPPSVPKFSIDWYANGGVFDSPTLFNYGGGIGGLGEAGAEAVVPLEKNTEWLDKIAERLGAGRSMAPIILQVDGKTFGQISVDSINQLTRQTGKLGLRLT